MFPISDVLVYDLTLPLRVAPTGVGDLDGVTGGVRQGAVWLITGAARSGRTVFCAQVAREAASSSTRTHLLAGQDGVTALVTLLVSSANRVTLNRVREGRLDPDELARARATAESWPVTLRARGFTPLERVLVDAKGPGVLVVDDLDLWSQDPLDAVDRVRGWASGDGRAAVVSLPSHLLPRGGPDWQHWVRRCAVVLELRLHDAGENGLSLRIVSHRDGPVAEIHADAVYGYARIESPGSVQRVVSPPK